MTIELAFNKEYVKVLEKLFLKCVYIYYQDQPIYLIYFKKYQNAKMMILLITNKYINKAYLLYQISILEVQ